MNSKKLPAGSYTNISLTAKQISEGVYMQYLGGGSEAWDARGLFQLVFMQKMGLCTNHRFLDIGCGPGRAGRFFIEFLEAENYYGIDYNDSFILAAGEMVNSHGLQSKRPIMKTAADFSIPEEFPAFDFALAFSVLNHCSQEQCDYFFSKIPRKIVPGGKLYVTHAKWFTKENMTGTDLVLTRTIDDIGISITDYGWKAGETVFPILEFTKNPSITSI